MTMRDHYGHENASITGVTNPNIVGPGAMSFDNWRCQGWDILTHGGFLTYPLHSAMCTYVIPRVGTKMFFFMRVKKDVGVNTSDELFKLFDDIVFNWDKDDLFRSDKFEIGAYPVSVGDVL